MLGGVAGGGGTTLVGEGIRLKGGDTFSDDDELVFIGVTTAVNLMPSLKSSFSS